MKKTYLLYLFLLISNISLSQQLPQFSQRMIDVLQYNPAYAGSKMNPELIMHYRNQWVGFENAPTTKSVSIHGKINRLMGLGAYIIGDAIGPSKTLSLNLSYAHHINFDAFALSFGLGGNFLRYGIDGREISIHEQNDNAVSLTSADNVWKPDRSFGTYIHGSSFYFGISAVQLLKSKIKIFMDENKEGLIPLSRHYYITAGYMHNILTIEIEPSFMFYKAPGSPSQLDFNLNVKFMDNYLTGISYRYDDSIIILLGARFFEKYKIAYSYDLVISPLRKHNSGSHEIILSYKLPNTKKYNRYKHEYQYDFNPKTKKWRERW